MWNFDESTLTRLVLIEIDILGIVQITHLSIFNYFGFVGLIKMFIRKVNEVVDKVSFGFIGHLVKFWFGL